MPYFLASFDTVSRCTRPDVLFTLEESENVDAQSLRVRLALPRCTSNIGTLAESQAISSCTLGPKRQFVFILDYWHGTEDIFLGLQRHDWGPAFRGFSQPRRLMLLNLLRLPLLRNLHHGFSPLFPSFKIFREPGRDLPLSLLGRLPWTGLANMFPRRFTYLVSHDIAPNYYLSRYLNLRMALKCKQIWVM